MQPAGWPTAVGRGHDHEIGFAHVDLFGDPGFGGTVRQTDLSCHTPLLELLGNRREVCLAFLHGLQRAYGEIALETGMYGVVSTSSAPDRLAGASA
jgi:hypothetical protein